MAGSLNALGLLLVVGVTIIIVIKYGCFPRGFKPVLNGLLWGALAWLVAAMFTRILWYEGLPFTQILIPAVCLAICVSTLEGQPHLTKVIYFLFPFLASLLLGIHFLVLVGGNNYNGNPKWINIYVHSHQQQNLVQVKSIFFGTVSSKPRLAQTIYSAGPLSASLAMQLFSAADRDTISHFVRSGTYSAYPLWHTWLTGLYGKRFHPATLWYPGGKLEDAIDRLEYKPIQ